MELNATSIAAVGLIPTIYSPLAKLAKVATPPDAPVVVVASAPPEAGLNRYTVALGTPSPLSLVLSELASLNTWTVKVFDPVEPRKNGDAVKVCRVARLLATVSLV